MPCFVDSDHAEEYHNRHRKKRDRDEIIQLTQLFCEADRQLLKTSGWWELSGEFKNWASLHNHADRVQDQLQHEKHELENSNLKQQALAKLSAEERKALGLI